MVCLMIHVGVANRARSRLPSLSPRSMQRNAKVGFAAALFELALQTAGRPVRVPVASPLAHGPLPTRGCYIRSRTLFRAFRALRLLLLLQAHILLCVPRRASLRWRSLGRWLCRFFPRPGVVVARCCLVRSALGRAFSLHHQLLRQCRAARRASTRPLDRSFAGILHLELARGRWDSRRQRGQRLDSVGALCGGPTSLELVVVFI